MPLTALVVLILPAPASFAAAPAARHDCKSGMVYVHGVAYATIQDAVDAAPDGATVRICSGTYFENIVVDSDVTLEGAGADRTIVDGSEDGSVVRVDGSDVDLTLRGLTLQHGTGTAIDTWFGTDYPCGGGVEAYGAKSLDIGGSVIQENTAEIGGGICGPASGSATISGTVIRNNDCGTGAGGGVALFGGEATLASTTISNNTAGLGGGVYFSGIVLTGGGGYYISGSVVADDDTVITGNVAAAEGGGVEIYRGLTWYGGRVENNDAGTGGGMYLAVDPGEGEVRHVAIVGNHSDDEAGGIFLSNGGTLRDSSVTDNTADGDGGGLYVFNYGAYSMGRGNGVTVRNSVVAGNLATGHGGGAYVKTRLNSIDTDWGEGELDNGPDDVYFVGSEGLHDHHQDPAAYTGFGDGADFTCFQHEGVCE